MSRFTGKAIYISGFMFFNSSQQFSHATCRYPWSKLNEILGLHQPPRSLMHTRVLTRTPDKFPSCFGCVTDCQLNRTKSLAKDFRVTIIMDVSRQRCVGRIRPRRLSCRSFPWILRSCPHRAQAQYWTTSATLDGLFNLDISQNELMAGSRHD